LSIEVEESEISILTKILDFLKKIWESLTKFKIVVPKENLTETSYINQTIINQTNTSI